ncbi:hypothetical protein CR513_52244, partial [Mucuna pruriens]
MLKVISMPKEFWVEVVSCVVYLFNCFPTKNARVDHLNIRVFGSINAYIHVPKQERSKLDGRSVKHVFIVYDAN